MGDDRHRELMSEAVERDGDAQRALLAGDGEAARSSFGAAARLYRSSWEIAPARSFGRLIGMLKSSILAGNGREESEYVGRAVSDDDVTSPAAAYCRALAALVAGDDTAAREWAARMHGGSEAFARTADAITALASRDETPYAAALAAIVRDFEQRQEHLTGVAVADTALMLEELARRRGIAAAVDSPLLPTTLRQPA